MSLAELERALASKMRVKKVEAQERAAFDYIHAQLITKGVNIAFTGKGVLPEYNEVYAALLTDDAKQEKIQEEKQKKRAELSALRFQLFAQSFNSRFKEGKKSSE